MAFYAHSKEGLGQTGWQLLADHETAVAKMARGFACPFASGAWAFLLGMLHDLGKRRRAFQAYLARSNGIADAEYDGGEHGHSGVGTCWAVQAFGKLGRILAYCIAGHHAGLPDWIGGATPNGALGLRLDEEGRMLAEPDVRTWIDEHKNDWKPPAPPWAFNPNGYELSFWIRMLYSCLVDADFLDTEAFMDSEQSSLRASYPELAGLSEAFFNKLDGKQKTAAKTEVNRIRAEIRSACEKAAELQPGIFSLSVPTGGGKTLSAMAFAFRHALRYDKKRIIYVIPYTSIIEQTADALRGFLGDANVLEHHSNFDPDKETQQSRLAAENWDAPVIVTTTVQFFESLYAYRSGRCRKLHNIADSVVILDEVQLLPTHLLEPCTEAIRQLAAHYGATVVLSTATQPALPGLVGIREMIPDDLSLYARLKRVEYELPSDFTVRQSWPEVAKELQSEQQVLCVVNTRGDCRELFDLMPEGTIHLSASMCGEHRSRVVAEIKASLSAGRPIRVVSTQLVEAGVDIDFPVVYRAFTGLASIVQSAGRCNREGKLPRYGRVVVFIPPKEGPKGDLRNGEYAMMDLLNDPDCPSLESADVFPIYFAKQRARAHALGEEFRQWLARDAVDFQFQFREAASAFQMIDDAASAAVIVRYGGNEKLIESLRAIGPKRGIMRRLQRYTVNAPRNIVQKYVEAGLIEEMHPGIFVQTVDSIYSGQFGLDLRREGLSIEECML